MISRVVAIVTGAAILTTVAHVNITLTGGYGTPHSYVTMAVAVGVCCGSVFVVMAWDGDRRMLAIFLVCSIVAGEAYNFLATAERLIKGREHEQVPLREAREVRDKAATRLEDAKLALDHIPTTSKRLEDATRAKADADKAATDKSAERGCRENCRQLLQAQVDAASADVKSAQADLDEMKAKAEAEVTAASIALAGLRLPDSPTPLADRTGIPAWIIDMVTSALGSIAANGLACCLLIFGAHHRAPGVEILTPVMLGPAEPLKPPRHTTARDHAARFAVECLRPGGEAELDAIRRRYDTWPHKMLPAAETARALAHLFSDAGIRIDNRDGRLVAIGISLKGG